MRSPLSPSTPLVLVTALALAAAAVGMFLASRPSIPEKQPDVRVRADRVILISLDTLRQDHMSLYGYPRPTTPNLDAFAAKSTVFTNAMSQAPYTLPSHMTMMTGMHPLSHNVRYHQDRLAENYVTIAERLQSTGFKTAGFTDGGFLESRHGFDAGFDVYDDKAQPGWVANNGFRRRSQQLKDWIFQRQRDRFFLFFHTFDCHAPYVTDDDAKAALAGTTAVVPEGARAFPDPIARLKKFRIHDYMKLDQYASIDELIDAYDATIRFVDQRLGELLTTLETLGLLDTALVIITSDHGESFLDHGVYAGHGLTLYEEEVRVPLIVKFPGGRFAGVRNADVVRLIDLYPTICAACEIDTPIQVEGIDLEDALLDRDTEPRVALGESPNFADHKSEGMDGVTNYVRRENLKYIDGCKIGVQALMDGHLGRVAPGEPYYDLKNDPLGMKAIVSTKPQLFDLTNDPHERVDLAAQQQELIERIRPRLTMQWDAALAIREVVTQGMKPAEIEDTIEMLEQLVQQGYISVADFERRKQVLEMRKFQEELDRKEREKKKDAEAPAPAESGSKR
ncbi:MAG: sulfatase [Planctomycetes bacterium]|nr:sulfatase [Planctomycetota bacterium]MCC7169357.1 sulfatase [Planctomycetota bacterium]